MAILGHYHHIFDSHPAVPCFSGGEEGERERERQERALTGGPERANKKGRGVKRWNRGGRYGRNLGCRSTHYP